VFPANTSSEAPRSTAGVVHMRTSSTLAPDEAPNLENGEENCRAQRH
jgi:hypothetical protein